MKQHEGSSEEMEMQQTGIEAGASSNGDQRAESHNEKTITRMGVEFTRENVKEDAAVPVEQRGSKDFGGWKICDLRCAMIAKTERPPWVIEDLLMEQSATLVSATPHAMKSLSWLGACLEAAVTQRVWGHFAAPKVRSTLFLETEDPPWMVEARIRGFAEGLKIKQGQSVPGFHYASVGPFELLTEKDRFKKMIDDLKLDFIVLSTLQNLLAGRDWNRQDHMQPVMALLIELSRICPLVLITHSPWDKRAKRAAGTVTQAANFLTTMHYEKSVNSKTGETFAHVIVDSKAGAQETNFSLRLTTSGEPRDPQSVRTIVYDGKGYARGLKRDSIFAELDNDPDATTQEIADRVGCTQRHVEKTRKQWEEQRKKPPKRTSPSEFGDVVLAE